MTILPAAKSGTREDLYLPPFAYFFWFLAALMLWLSLSSAFDSIVVFNYATVQQPDDLETVTFTIIDVSSHTPNFKVRFGNGATAWMSFPDRLGGNPKGGLEMTHITDHGREQLKGCLATAKVRSVLSAYGKRMHVWDLECPRAHIHYGPEVTSSEIRGHPRFDLMLDLVFDAFFLVGACAMAMIARKFGERPA
jgi:hypothetical protein